MEMFLEEVKAPVRVIRMSGSGVKVLVSNALIKVKLGTTTYELARERLLVKP